MIKKINTYNTYCMCCIHNKNKLCDILGVSCLEFKESDKDCEKWEYKEVADD